MLILSFKAVVRHSRLFTHAFYFSHHQKPNIKCTKDPFGHLKWLKFTVDLIHISSNVMKWHARYFSRHYNLCAKQIIIILYLKSNAVHVLICYFRLFCLQLIFDGCLEFGQMVRLTACWATFSTIIICFLLCRTNHCIGVIFAHFIQYPLDIAIAIIVRLTI